MAFIQDIDNDVKSHPIDRTNEIRLSQFENGRMIYFNVTGVEIPAGSTATISGTKPDGVVYSKVCQIDDNQVILEEDVQLTAATGKWQAKIHIVNGGNVLSTSAITFNIDKDPVDEGAIPSDSQIEGILAEVKAYADSARSAAYGSPLVAGTVADMIDQAKVYVYTGSETGYTAGDWYYFDGTNWVSGGVYNSEGVQLDGTLSVRGLAADSKAAGDAIGEVNDSMSARIGTAEDEMQTIEQQMTTYCDELEVDEEGLVYLLNNGERIAGPYGPFAGGGGGGGGGNNAVVTITNTTGWLKKTISEGSACTLSFQWSSIEDEIPTGDGTLTVKVGNVVKSMINIAQGAVNVNVSNYLSAGANSVRLTVADVYGNTKSINFRITVVSMSISSSFDSVTPKNGAFQYTFTPVGNVEKTVYFEVDGQAIGTMVTTASNRQLSYTIPAQSHGSHTLKVYFTALIDSETVRSNELFYDLICIEDGITTPVIASDFRATTAEQYETLVIPYTVYVPDALSASVTLEANGEEVSTLTVDRTPQTWSYGAYTVGQLVLTITAGVTTKTFTINVTESSIDAKVTTEDMVLSLQSTGRSNNEQNPDTWVYEDIECSFSGFNHKSDGWQIDESGSTALRVAGDARLTIPYKAFETDFRAAGKTLEIDFATRDVLNYDAVILSCMNDNRGLQITAQGATLKSEQSSVAVQFKENEHIRLSFVVEKRTENRLIYVYLNGVLSGAIQYPDNDDFSQTTPQNISVGSNLCTMDIYSIRIYDNDLTRTQMLNNWIADTQSVETMLARYEHNNVYDEYDNIVISKLPTDLPYMIITAPQLPQYKGDKKTVSVTYTDPQNASKSFEAINVQADVQGTSSQYYPRKNYKLKFNGGFTINGELQSKYQMRSDSIPTKTFTMKADVASSEGANNVELARLYNDVCPYETPAQEENPNIRQGIDGFPMVMFWNNGTETVFIGKYNFNNDKGTEEVFGFVEGDESWEIKNNTSDRVIWKSDDYTGSDWLNDFEARYPDTTPPYTNPAQLAEFATWVKSTDTAAATGDELPEPVTYGTGDDEVTYTNDTADYRLAKFKYEAGNYMEIDSAIFYYLFTELFLMVDSRAKNAFPSFMGGTINE
jgi:hypothetical protein